MKFKLIGKSMVLEDVYVNDMGPLRFLATTDSPKTILDKDLADRLGLRLEGPYPGMGLEEKFLLMQLS